MAILADGTTLEISDGGSGAYVAVPNLKTVTPPSPETPEIETTHLGSAAKEYIPATKPEPGEFMFTAYYVYDQYTRLEGLRGVIKSFRLTYPDTHTSTFQGFIKKVEKPEHAVQALVEMSCTVKVTGAITNA